MIEARDLHKAFRQHAVLAGASFEIEKGESVVIIGRSGGGKSILLKLLVGLIEPDRGSIHVDGQAITGKSERELLQLRTRFGMLFQSAALFDSLTVAENVAFALRRIGGLTESELAARVARSLDLVDLNGTQTKMPSELSGGMRKRVGLARAIVYNPEIILFDEPTTGLDPIMADSIDQLILRIGRELKVTSIVVTHDMKSAQRIAQRIMMLHEGQIYASGTTAEIFESKDAIVQRFVTGTSNGSLA